MPNGFGAVLSAMLITMFSFMGAEIVPLPPRNRHAGKHIVRATNSVIWRISHFSICVLFFVVVALIPCWNMPGPKAVGSYRSVLESAPFLMRNYC